MREDSARWGGEYPSFSFKTHPPSTPGLKFPCGYFNESLKLTGAHIFRMTSVIYLTARDSPLVSELAGALCAFRFKLFSSIPSP
jgi:hypothetical protein